MVAALANRIALADTSSSLPDAAKNGGMSLVEALSLSQSTRLFADKPIDDETLSTLLWCAFGMNRQELRVHFKPVQSLQPSAGCGVEQVSAGAVDLDAHLLALLRRKPLS